MARLCNMGVGAALLAAAIFSQHTSVFAGPLKSVYTKFNLGSCSVLKLHDEGGGVDLKCRGHKGLDIFVSEGDLRFDIDYGVSNESWDSFGPFNRPHTTVEWILDGETAIAAIHRFFLDTGEGNKGSKSQVLKISSIGTKGKPGCPVAYVNATHNKNANELARKAAPEAVEFKCGADQPKIHGQPGNLKQPDIASR